MLVKWERTGPKEAFDVVDSMNVSKCGLAKSNFPLENGFGYDRTLRFRLQIQQLLSS